MRRRLPLLSREHPTLSLWGYVLIVVVMWSLVVAISLRSSWNQRGSLNVARTAGGEQNRIAWLGHGLLWIVGLAIIGSGGWLLQGSLRALQGGEEQYRSLIQGIQAAIVVHNARGRIVMSNPTARRLLGLSEQQMVGKGLQDEAWRFLREDGMPMSTEEYPVDRVLDTGQPVRDLVVGVPDAETSRIRWALVNADPVSDGAGEINQVIVTFMDITEQKRAEDVNEARLRIASASTKKSPGQLMRMTLDEIEALTDSKVGFYHVLLEDQETIVLQTWSTNTLQNMCGAEGEGKHYPVSKAGVWVDCVRERRPVIHNDYASLPHRKGMPPGHAPIDRELVFPIVRAGRIVAIVGVGNKPTDYDQEDVEIISLLGDFSWEIFERKRAEQEVVQQKEMLENTLESLTYPFFVVNADDYTLEITNSAAVPSGELPEASTCYAITHQRDAPCNGSEHPCPLQEVLACQEHVVMEHIHRGPDGSPRHVEVHGYPVFDAEGNVAQMIEYIIDITRRKLARKALAEKKEALARSNAELEEFAYIASHDLQEPLRKVQAFGDRLQTQYADVLDDRGRDYLARMQNAAFRMRNLINDLLAYSRVTTKSQPFDSVDLNDVVEDVISDLAVRIEETGGRVEVGELPTIDADPVQMRRMLQNLISNALKFHQEGKPPVVKVSNEVSEASDGFCHITVKDNGIGFDEKYLEKVFAPFQRLHGRSEYEGTGMGMAICRKIVQRHHGRITAESESNRGTIVTITLPVEQRRKGAL